MPIIKKYNKKGIDTYIVDKEYDDDKIEKKLSKFIKRHHIHTFINNDADVYNKDMKLLLRFRKNALTVKNIDDFYDNIIDFAKKTTSNRGTASGSKHKLIGLNPRVMTNIFGFFDKWSPSQKVVFQKLDRKPLIDVRECRFNMDSPDKYKMTIPLIKEVDLLYKKLTPTQYTAQKKKADATYFKIADTAFTTVTTNVNFQTSIHTDSGDDIEGFGNLIVIEKGSYTGGETCFPQYGIGVDVRNSDVLFMDVHEPHGNLAIKKHTNDAIRLSVVCYLRKNVWLRTLDKTKAFFMKHLRMLHKVRENVKLI